MADILEKHFQKESLGILNISSLKSIPGALIDNKSALVLAMAWHQAGDKPLSDPVVNKMADACIHQ